MGQSIRIRWVRVLRAESSELLAAVESDGSECWNQKGQNARIRWVRMVRAESYELLAAVGSDGSEY